MTGTLTWFIFTTLTSYLNIEQTKWFLYFYITFFLFFLLFCINNKSRITHVTTDTDMIVKGGGPHRFCRHSWPCCRQPEASFREKNILGDWLTTNSDLMLCVLSFGREVFQTSDIRRKSGKKWRWIKRARKLQGIASICRPTNQDRLPGYFCFQFHRHHIW